MSKLSIINQKTIKKNQKRIKYLTGFEPVTFGSIEILIKNNCQKIFEKKQWKILKFKMAIIFENIQ